MEHGRIRLLCDFEDYLFTTPPSEDLKEEEKRLRKLSDKMKEDYYPVLFGPMHEGAEEHSHKGGVEESEYQS